MKASFCQDCGISRSLRALDPPFGWWIEETDESGVLTSLCPECAMAEGFDACEEELRRDAQELSEHDALETLKKVYFRACAEGRIGYRLENAARVFLSVMDGVINTPGNWVYEITPGGDLIISVPEGR